MPGRVLIVGSGFFGAVCARELTDAGFTCLVVERRPHIGGNCFTRFDAEAGCHEHIYGPHIFHTDSEMIWKYVNRFASFNHFINRPRVCYRGRMFSFPINLLTLHQVFGVNTPEEAERELERRRVRGLDQSSAEGWSLATVGRELYEMFIEGYTTKQWQRPPSQLPASIVRRMPIRLTYDDNYYTHRYQGVPVGGYTGMFERLLAGVRCETGVDFLRDRDEWMRAFDTVIYSGPIDAFFEYERGALEYRTLRFERERIQVRDYQGNAIVNYTDAQVPFTRVVEHKHFDLNLSSDSTLVTREFPMPWSTSSEPYYPIETPDNRQRYAAYQDSAMALGGKVIFGGRLGAYRYYDMHQVIGAALTTVKQLCGGQSRLSAALR
jgi:UDP-galactopyranose mutase